MSLVYQFFFGTRVYTRKGRINASWPFLSVCPSVTYGLLTRKQNKHRKTNISKNVPAGQVQPVCWLSVHKVKGQGHRTSNTSW